MQRSSGYKGLTTSFLDLDRTTTNVVTVQQIAGYASRLIWRRVFPAADLFRGKEN